MQLNLRRWTVRVECTFVWFYIVRPAVKSVKVWTFAETNQNSKIFVFLRRYRPGFLYFYQVNCSTPTHCRPLSYPSQSALVVHIKTWNFDWEPWRPEVGPAIPRQRREGSRLLAELQPWILRPRVQHCSVLLRSTVPLSFNSWDKLWSSCEELEPSGKEIKSLG